MPGTVGVRPLDVGDLASVRRFTETWSGDLDIPINNAGVMDIPAERTADGVDPQTTTNYTGPLLLTNLMPEYGTDRVVHPPASCTSTDGSTRPTWTTAPARTCTAVG
ncbi:hypothetical protein ABT275_43250 [Streptomyces sp. NPDC001185]|uniref:hypothetical protein n=1 Tax=Streptomyces sp. NPDC001185 TaxID=3154380 RepID=UPI0033302E0A